MSGSGSMGKNDEDAENALIQQMNPFAVSTITSYFAAQTLVAMMVPHYDDVAKVGRCRSTVSEPVFKARMVSALETVI